MPREILCVRVESKIKADLERATNHAYSPSKAKIVERGIELALRELRKLEGYYPSLDERK